jgi:cyclic pyranopterin phosphate synthase
MEIPGMAEAMRAYGTERDFHAMVSRSIAGFIGDALVLTLPGTVSGARDSFYSVRQVILHLLNEVK